RGLPVPGPLHRRLARPARPGPLDAGGRLHRRRLAQPQRRHRRPPPRGRRGGAEVTLGRRLERIETVLLDLDGTLYVGSQVVDGAPEAVRWLREQGLAVRFCTNTDSVPPAALAERLAGRGF